MNELTLDGKTYVSSKRAAEITGYAKDYVGQLCREGHVEARLVGRNWYVLESSIRAHRFGKESVVEESAPEEVKVMPQTWNQPKYVAEEPAPLPVLSSESSEVVEPVMPTTSEENVGQQSVLTDMESAWREWFDQKEAGSSEMPEIRESEPVEEAAEPALVEEEPVPIEIRVAPRIEASEAVATERISVIEPQDQVLDLSKGVVEYPPAEPAKPEARVIEERIYPRNSRKKKSSGAHRLSIQSAFIGAALVAVAIAVVGTGFAQKILGSSLYRLPEINIIAGVSEINK